MAGSITSLQHATSYKTPGDDAIWANIGGDKIVYLATKEIDGVTKVYAKVSKKSAIEDIDDELTVTPYKMGDVVLSANDLNTMLYAGLPATDAKSTDYFDLSFNPNLASVFTESQLQAVAVENKELKYASTTAYSDAEYASLKEVNKAYQDKTAGYVALKNVKGEYLVVDTAYVPGTDNNNNGLLKFTTDKLYNSKNETRYRHPGSYKFKFTLNVTDQNVTIESYAFVRRSAKAYGAAGAPTGADNAIYGSVAEYYENSFDRMPVQPGSHWWYNTTFTGTDDGGVVSEDVEDYDATRFVTHVLLNTEDLVTLGEMKPATAATQSNIIDIKVGAQNIYIPTTMADGAYLLQNVKTGKYLINNLVGTREEVEQAARQNFQHMPAAQWIVTSNGNATTVVNREFETTYKSGILYKGAANNQGFFYGDAEYKFIPVAEPTDKYQGYKWVTDEELDGTRFTFNYLHDLAMDKPLNTINTKDSVVWVDKDGEAMSFSLVKVIDDEYGYTAGLKNVSKLNRRVYQIKVNDANKLVNNNRYLAYDADLKKYVVSTGSGAYFFLKENNEVEGGDCYNLLLRPNTVYAGKFDPAEADSNIKEGRFLNGTISSVAHYVTDNDIAGYFQAVWGTVTTADGLKAEGWVPAVAWYSANDIEGVSYLTSEDQGKALGFTSGENDVTYEPDNWKLNSNGNTYYLGYIELDPSNSDYANAKVSVDNNTLALVNGVLSDGTSREVANSAFALKYAETQLYRRVDGMENVKVFRVNSTEKEYLYEDALSKYSAGKEFNFLGVEGKGDAKNAAMFLDTAYVNRETIMPQYMFVLRPEFVEADTIWCNATEGHKHATLADSLACEHTSTVAQSVKGWYLVNLTDSVAVENARIANADGGILTNKYQLDKTTYTRLGFVKATHIGDNLIIENSIYTGNTDQINPGYATTWASKDTINLSKNEHNKVAFSFRLVDDSDNFLIESQGDKKAPTYGGWIKIQNGVPVIAEYSDYNEAVYEAELFNLEATEDAPTANESVEAAEVSVVAVQGAIIVKGAAGKVVTVANILGQTIANQVAASDNVTIAAPAGVAVVTVDGEATKVIVK
ncbi:MAG: DUF6383 domain-containing protein [Parabacteroides sp.]